MATKVNIVLDDDVKAELETLVKSGRRSRVINTALRKELLAMRRQRLSEKLDRLRRKTRPGVHTSSCRPPATRQEPVMPAPVVVPDASVLVKWALESREEADQAKALSIRNRWLAGDCHIVVPPLWVYEVGNVLASKQPALAPELLEVLVGYRFHEEAADDSVKEIYTLVRDLKVTFHDAAYHAAAIRSQRHLCHRR